MPPSQNNTRLPPEILEEIFNNVIKKDRLVILNFCEKRPNNSTNKVLVNLSLVCKSWKSIIQEYFSSNILIKVTTVMIPTLLERLPYIGYAVKSIELTGCLNWYDKLIGDMENPKYFRQVVEFCPNLLSLRFSEFDLNNMRYMEVLTSPPMIKLKNIQTIRVNSSDHASRRFQTVYNSILYHNRATINELHLYTKHSDSFFKSNDELAQFITYFPNLIFLKVNCGCNLNSRGKIDIKQLVQSAPQLQELILCRAYEITADFQSKAFVRDPKEVHLINLKLNSVLVNVKSLEYITSTVLKHVNSLYWSVGKFVSQGVVSEEQSEKILNDFETRIARIENVNIKYKYKDKNIYTNHGKTALNLKSCRDTSSGYYSDSGDSLKSLNSYTDYDSDYIFQDSDEDSDDYI